MDTKILTDNITKFYNAIELMRSLDAEIPSQMISSFLLIATHPGITQRDLAVRLRLGSSSTNRHVAVLSRHGILGRKGLDLVELVENPENRREKGLYLTAKGQRVIKSLLDILGG